MYRKIFRIILVLCLLAAPAAMVSCATERTEMESHTETLGKSPPRTIVTGDGE